MEAGLEIPNSTQNQIPPREKGPRPPRNRLRNANRTADPSTEPRENEPPNRQRRPYRPPREDADGQARSSPSSSQPGPSQTGSIDNALKKRTPRRRNPPNPTDAGDTRKSPENAGEATKVDSGSRPPQPAGRAPRRGAKFNAGLTEPGSGPSSSDQPANKYRNKAHARAPEREADDLTSRLTHDLRTPPYPDCPICFSSITPAQRTWSCSPSIPVIRPPDAETEEQQYCWTTFHVKCIGEWAAKSVKDMANAWRARGEEGRKGDWRCPGCQGKREIVPSGYWCFCNSTAEPKPPRLATPHSCANPCSRVRESGCGHPCPLPCHPGPCPPCQVTTRLECYCPQKKIMAFRCGVDKGKKRDLSCGSVCRRKLGCGNHVCEEVCHEGPCAACLVREEVKCWCGSSTKEIGCGEGEEIRCVNKEGNSWAGRYGCEVSCQVAFDCGIHKCEEPCHPPHSSRVCPLSPSLITTCPCGAHPIARSPSSPLPQTHPKTFPARSSCTAPIPTCNSPCSKPLSGCDHACAAPCHDGPCPPCAVPIVRPCRCGSTTRGVRCAVLRESTEIQCDKQCMALRACGRHQCRRVCCPLATLASAAGKKGKKRATGVAEVGVGEEQGGLHECDLVCGKMLGCGLHPCEERDHKGACPPCLRSSFEEMVCYCGRTVFEPPIPCGTQMRCTYQCSRPPPPCGHPQSQHACHEDPRPCPPCPFLATKQCACGKKMMTNVRCSLETEKVSCGAVCGKLMDCGFHHCERLCHGDKCGTCTAPCGKSRKRCLPVHHPCTLPCHAPSSCPEDEPCTSLVTLACPCGRLRQSVHCGRSTATPAGRQQTAPKCNSDCAIAKRNARLADALGITAESREKAATVTYHEELVVFARANAKFLGVVEKAFDEFVTTQKKTQVLPHMPPDRRKFVHDLAAVYRMDTQMVDQEPHRSVRLLRRIDTRIPSPLLSSTIVTSVPAQPNLGKLADLRSTAPSWRASPSPAPKPSGSGSGWATPARPVSAAGTGNVQALRLPASGGVTRAASPARVPVVETPTTPVVVPDDWEDDV
ncbi:hypothetical protein FPV67DRAFT_1626152 [Lyophyllum atratum]|nr:hypothetical protein FPV67DRAFT_1626152 [Lyophyllum atratum]